MSIQTRRVSAFITSPLSADLWPVLPGRIENLWSCPRPPPPLFTDSWHCSLPIAPHGDAGVRALTADCLTRLRFCLCRSENCCARPSRRGLLPPLSIRMSNRSSICWLVAVGTWGTRIAWLSEGGGGLSEGASCSPQEARRCLECFRALSRCTVWEGPKHTQCVYEWVRLFIKGTKYTAKILLGRNLFLHVLFRDPEPVEK